MSCSAGVPPVAGERSPIMPGFADVLTDPAAGGLARLLCAPASAPAGLDRPRQGRSQQQADRRLKCRTTLAADPAAATVQRSETSHDDLKVNGQRSPDRRRPRYAAALRAARRLAAQWRQVRLRARTMRRLHGDGGRQGGAFPASTPIAAAPGTPGHDDRGARAPPTTPGVVQRAFIEEQAAQCGYCIAGMMMRAQALLERNPIADRRPRSATR